MTTDQRLTAFSKLHQYLKDFISSPDKSLTEWIDFHQAITEAKTYNGWFTEENIYKAINGLIELTEPSALKEATEKINYGEQTKTIAIIMAGNIPAVGFHDLLCVLLSGNTALIKLSSDDTILIPFLLKKLLVFEPEFSAYIKWPENKLANFDAVIATGSNNSANYFKTYFGKYPHIIRKNRNSVAVITGKETPDQLSDLGSDIFDFFGLGCRNVSKLYVPREYNFNLFFESIFHLGNVIDNKKYANNYEYNRALYLMMQEKFLDNNFLVLKEDAVNLSSPVGVLLFQYYDSIGSLRNFLFDHKEEIQCIASANEIPEIKTIPFGKTQCPGFFDYADEVDVIAFINSLQ